MIKRQLELAKKLVNVNSKSTVWIMVIIFLIIFNLDIMYNYGKTFEFVKLLYIPIIISACVFGIKGSVVTAIFAGISVRPFIIINSLNTTIQIPSSWITQTMIFLIVSVIFSEVFKYYFNIQEFLKISIYKDIQYNHCTSILNMKSIINAIKYRKTSFAMFEYKNLDIINKNTNYVTGKKTCELIIVNKYDYVDKFNEIHEEIAS